VVLPIPRVFFPVNFSLPPHPMLTFIARAFSVTHEVVLHRSLSYFIVLSSVPPSARGLSLSPSFLLNHMPRVSCSFPPKSIVCVQTPLLSLPSQSPGLTAPRAPLLFFIPPSPLSRRSLPPKALTVQTPSRTAYYPNFFFSFKPLESPDRPAPTKPHHHRQGNPPLSFFRPME